MPKLNIKQFVSMMDGAQDEDTTILVCVNGEEIASGTLENALDQIENSNPDSDFIVKSFMFWNKYITLECEVQ